MNFLEKGFNEISAYKSHGLHENIFKNFPAKYKAWVLRMLTMNSTFLNIFRIDIKSTSRQKLWFFQRTYIYLKNGGFVRKPF